MDTKKTSLLVKKLESITKNNTRKEVIKNSGGFSSMFDLKKLCGFPEEFKITESVNIYDLFGNMATPPVITNILKLIYD